MCRKCRCRHCCGQNRPNYNECDIEKSCDNISNFSNYNKDECACGFDEEFNVFPEYPMYAQSYVPFQMMDKTFIPTVGLRKGTIFPELVSPYYPNQSVEEIAYIEATNKIGEGCNKC